MEAKDSKAATPAVVQIAQAPHDPVPVTVTSTAVEESKTTTDETTLREQGNRDAAVLKTSGQRRINFLWELTQSVMGLSIMAATVYAELNGIHSSVLGNAFVLIIGLYFVRTNHTKIGGPGTDDSR